MSAFTPVTPSPYTSPYQYQQQPNNAPNDPGVYGESMNIKNSDFTLFTDDAEPEFDGLAAYSPPRMDFNTFHATLQATDRYHYVPTADMAIAPAPNYFNEAPQISNHSPIDHANHINQVPQIPGHSPIDNTNPINYASPVINPSALNNGTAHPNLGFHLQDQAARSLHVDMGYMGSSMQSSMISSPRSPLPRAPSTCATSPDLNQHKLSLATQDDAALFTPSVQSPDEGFHEPRVEAGTPLTDFSLVDPIDEIINNPTNPGDTMADAPMEDLDPALADEMYSELAGQFHEAMWAPRENSMVNTMDIDQWLGNI